MSSEPVPASTIVERTVTLLHDRSLLSIRLETLGVDLGIDQADIDSNFASMADLIAAIGSAIFEGEKDAEEATAAGDTDLDTYFAGIIAAFDWNFLPENMVLRRIQFEAATFGSIVPEARTASLLYHRWAAEARRDLVTLGLSEADAAIEARILNNLFDGFVYDLMLNAEADVTRAAFLVAMTRYRERLVHLIELSV